MYLFILGYLLGIFTLVARHLERSGKVHLRWFQWLFIVFGIVLVASLIHRYFDFELHITEETFDYTLKTIVVPIFLILGLIIVATSWSNLKKKFGKKEKIKEVDKEEID